MLQSGFLLGEACTIVLRSTTKKILDETQCLFYGRHEMIMLYIYPQYVY
jgi:hypothetical protein